MSRSRTSRPPARPIRSDASPCVIVADDAELAPDLGVYTIFLDIPRFETVYFRLVLESWEDGAVARTIHRRLETDRTRSLVVALVVPDYLEPCLRRMGRLCAEMDGRQVRSTPELQAALRAELVDPVPSDLDPALPDGDPVD